MTIKPYAYVVFIALYTCSCSSNIGKVAVEPTYERIAYYKGTKKIYCKYKIYKTKLIDTAFYFDSFGVIIAKHIYMGSKYKEEQYYEGGKLNYKIDVLGVIKHYSRGKLISVFKPKDSSCTFLYGDGSLKRFEKKCRGRIVYFNEYDSLTKKPVKFYREVEEKLEVINDSIVISPYFECNTFNMKDFKYSIIINNGGPGSQKKYMQQSKSPIFKFKIKQGLSWTKTICDSIGCYSLPVSLKTEH